MIRRRLVTQAATRTGPAVRGRGFTLIELIIAIGIIAVLVSLGLVVGSSSLIISKQRVTEDTLRVLNLALDAYVDEKGALPSPVVLDPRQNRGGVNTTVFLPVADARNMSYASAAPGVTDLPGPSAGLSGQQMINSVGLFMLQMQDVDDSASVLEGLDARIVRRYAPTVTELEGGAAASTVNERTPALPTAFDGFGSPIRYVHPAYDGRLFGGYKTRVNPGLSDLASAIDLTSDADRPRGVPPPVSAVREYRVAQLRRNAEETSSAAVPAAQDFADSDGGLCPGGRPYFYSVGADGDPSTREDNVYGVEPFFDGV